MAPQSTNDLSNVKNDLSAERWPFSGKMASQSENDPTVEKGSQRKNGLLVWENNPSKWGK